MARSILRTGAVEAAKSNTASFRVLDFFTLKADEVCYVRFLTDPVDWRVVDKHGQVPTKPRPADLKANAKWPPEMPFICRKTETGNGGTLWPDCYICDVMKTRDGKAMPRSRQRTLGLVCRREPVLGDGSLAQGGPGMAGQVIGYRDKTRQVQEVDDDGNVLEGQVKLVKDICLVDQGWDNFWSIVDGCAQAYGTVLDRDYWIKREGSGMNDTKYKINPMDPIKNFPKYESIEAMQQGIAVDGQYDTFDLRNAIHASRYGVSYEVDEQGPYRVYDAEIDLDAYVLRQTDVEYYGHFLIPGYQEKPRPGQSAPAPVQTAAESDPDRFASLRDRIVQPQPYAVDPAPAAPAHPEPAPAPVPEPAMAASAPAAPARPAGDFG